MALSYRLQRDGRFSELIYRNIFVTLDDSYPTGGYTLSPSAMGFQEIVAVMPHRTDVPVGFDVDTHTLRIFTHSAGSETKASKTTALTGANNDLVYTAKASVGFSQGNSITVAYVVPEDDDEAHELAVSVDGYDITVSLEVDTDGSTILSTGDDIKAAIAASEAASALVTVADAGGNDGSGVVTAMTAVSLTGGVSSGGLVEVTDEADDLSGVIVGLLVVGVPA